MDREAGRRRVQRVLERVHAEGTVVARTDGAVHEVFPVAIPAAEGAALTGWVVRERATRTIEVGLGYGVSALHLCEALLASADPAARHVAVDPHQATRFAGCGLRLLEEAGVGGLVELHQEESLLVLPRLLGEGRTFDLAFVDGDHRFDGVFCDLVCLGRLVRPGGIVVVDDHQLPAVARAVSFCTTNLGWTIEETSRVDELHAWAALRTPTVPDARSFDDDVEF